MIWRSFPIVKADWNTTSRKNRSSWVLRASNPTSYWLSGMRNKNPGSVSLSDFMGTDQMVTNVFLEANMAPIGLILAPYSNVGVLSTNLASDYLPDMIWPSWWRSWRSPMSSWRLIWLQMAWNSHSIVILWSWARIHHQFYFGIIPNFLKKNSKF